MAYTKSGNKVYDFVKFGNGICCKPATNEIPAKHGPNLHYCKKHAKQVLNKMFKAKGE